MSRIKVMSGIVLASLLTVLPFAGTVAAIAPSITYTASATTPFAPLTVSGGGFTPGEPIIVSFGLSSTSIVADGAGSFSGATLAIPALPSNLYIIVAVGQTSGLVAFTTIFVNSFFPVVAPNSWYLAPGAMLSWTGSGFAPTEGITVTDSHGTTVASFSTDASGAFSNAGAIRIPMALRNSTPTYTVHTSKSGTTLPITITISDLFPIVTPSTWYALPGTQVNFSAFGFGPGESVDLFLGSSASALGRITADASGAFTAQGSQMLPFNMPTAQYRLVGEESGAAVSVPITLASFYPNVTPSVWFTYPGNSVTFSGMGFAPNETVTMSGAGTGTTTTDTTGAFTGLSARIPASAVGMQNFIFTGANSSVVQTIGVTLGVRSAAIWFDNYYAQGGSPLTIFGTGFGDGENVRLSASGVDFTSTMADAFGALAAKTAIPFAPAGALSITATGVDTGVTAAASLTVAPVYTDFQLASYAVPAGSPITFIGRGFFPSEPMTVTTDRTGSSTIASFTADSTGSFTDSSFVIPADWTSGNLTVTAHGNHSFTSSSITLWVIGP